jgi:hypothetical protein
MADPRVLALERQARELGYTLVIRNPSPAETKLEQAMDNPELAPLLVQLIGYGHMYPDVATELAQVRRANTELTRTLERTHVALLVQTTHDNFPDPFMNSR